MLPETPLIWEKRFRSLKRIFSKYLTSFFGCCGRPNIWFVTLISLPSCSFAPSSIGPFFHLSGIFARGKNYGQCWNYHLKYLDVEKMVGKLQKSLVTYLPLLLWRSALHWSTTPALGASPFYRVSFHMVKTKYWVQELQKNINCTNLLFWFSFFKCLPLHKAHVLLPL